MKIYINGRSKKIIKFLVMLLIIGILIGIYIYLIQGKTIKGAISLELSTLNSNVASTKQNMILTHFIIMSIAIILSLIVVGLPLVLFYYFYEGISIGFLIMAFLKYKGGLGLLYALGFCFITKVIYLLIFTYFLVQSLKYGKQIIQNLKKDKKEIVYRQIIKCAFALIICLINDLLLYFIGNKLISMLSFLLKQ